MADGAFSRNDARSSPRFVPKARLSMFLAGSESPLVHGDVKDLSELGACVRADSSLDSGGTVTINVRNGYSFLFRAEARIVWRAPVRRPHESFDCTHGISFTELSPFTRKLIRRLGEDNDRPEVSPGTPVEGRVWDSDSDPDLQILFRAERSPAQVDKDRLDLLADPLFEPPLVNGHLEVLEAPPRLPEPVSSADSAVEDFLELDDLDLEPIDSVRLNGSQDNGRLSKFDSRDLERDLSGGAELSGNLGYFAIADVLQMLEASRATGLLYIDGPHTGEIQLLDGRIGGCFSRTLSAEEAAFHLIVARHGRFYFVPGRILGNVQKIRTTTQVLLEAQLRRDNMSPPSTGD